MSSRKEELFKKINERYKNNLDCLNSLLEECKNRSGGFGADGYAYNSAMNNLGQSQCNKIIYDEYNEYIDIIKTEYENKLLKIKILNDYIKEENLGFKEKYNKEYDFFKKKQNEYNKYNKEKELLKTYNNILIIILIYIISKYIIFF